MQRSAVGGSSGGGAGSADDGDNRSRNAKAQRRHREKRKAHFKALEESVQVLTAQLEEARRQLGVAAYASSSRLQYSPEAKDVAQFAAENAYLRDENADLRRQLYALRVNYGGREPSSAGGLQPPQSADPSKVPTGVWTEVKQEGSAGQPYGGVYHAPSTVVSPPRVGSSSHGRTMSHPGDFVRDPAAESGSTSSSASYPPPLYQFGAVVGEHKWAGQEGMSRHPAPRGSSSSSSRSRLLSSSSAPSASPYVNSAPFPTDPRAHALSVPNAGGYPVRYESAVYPAAPPPHNLPRSAISSSGGPPGSSGYTHGAAPVAYVPRPDGEVAWGPDVNWAAQPTMTNAQP